MMQGDQYELEFEIELDDGTPITDEMTEEVEFAFGGIRKTTADGVHYADGLWLLPLSQRETFRLKSKEPMQVRVKFADGSVVGAGIAYEEVKKSMSKVVL